MSDRTINAQTRLGAVLGHPIKHSASPAMQNAGFEALGLNWRYLAFDVHPDSLAQAINAAKTLGFVGLNLTVPHKILALNLVDVLDDSAKTWGAVNTIRFEALTVSGRWLPVSEVSECSPEKIRAHGFNTDADAITRSLREDLKVNLSGAKVLLLGAGGAGRTAALKLASEGVSELHLANRTASKAQEIAGDIQRRYPQVNVSVGYPRETVDLLINATSLGLNPKDDLPLDENKFALTKARAVYDMIYRPAETPLLKAARAAGCNTANGLGMLLYQGAKALEIWSGKTAPVEVMRRALEKNIYGN